MTMTTTMMMTIAMTMIFFSDYCEDGDNDDDDSVRFYDDIEMIEKTVIMTTMTVSVSMMI